MKQNLTSVLATFLRFLRFKTKRVRISRSALKRRTGPALMTFALLATLIFAPAYRFESADNRLTRFELAQMFETVLESCRISAQPDALPEYTDLDDEQLFGVYRTLSCGIMRGYPDQKFRPGEALRNIETISYLQKLIQFLRLVKPDSDAAQKLVRLMAYQDSPAETMAGRMSSFMPESLQVPSGFTDRETMAELISRVIGQYRPGVLDGRVVDALTGKPVARAFVASEKIATVTDSNGFFRIEYPSGDREEVTIMAAAEDFQPVELKKNINFNPTVVLRLKPSRAADRIFSVD